MRKKLLLIGIDQAIPYLLKKFYLEGILPNIGKLIENGVSAESYPCPPCDTPTNWTTIATGATTAVHGATSFYMHLLGEPLDLGLNYRSRTQLSRYCKAEYIWNVAEKNNLIPFVINYPGGWPINFRNGAMSLFTWSVPESLPIMLIPSKKYRIKDLLIIDQEIDKIKSYSPIIQAEIQFERKSIILDSSYKLYVFDHYGNGYDSLFLPLKDQKKAQIIKKGDWSNWIRLKIDTKYGKLPCMFKLKVLKIDINNGLTIQCSGVYNIKGWAIPESFGKELVKNVFEYDLPEKHKIEFMIYGGLSRFLKSARNESLTLAGAINYAKQKLNWDICYFHFHPLDTINHESLAYLYKESAVYSKEKYEKVLDNVRAAYMIVDELVKLLISSCVDDGTIIVFISDHGAIPVWKIANIPLAFKEAGLLDYNWNNITKNYIINWKKTLAFPYMEPPFVWVNLKGREVNGIVKPSEYEQVRENVIETFHNMKDPDTNKSIIAQVLKKEEAAHLGLNGERVGDIIYFLNPPYGIFDGKLSNLNATTLSKNLINKPLAYIAKTIFGAHAYFLPNSSLGNFTISAPLIINGPGIRRGVELKKPVEMIDIVPTLAHLLEIPAPKQSQGKIIYDALI